MNFGLELELERKFCSGNDRLEVEDGAGISGYASLFGQPDNGGDIVERGAYSASLEKLRSTGRNVKFLWQHDPLKPIGVWDEIREDENGLFVKGRLLTETQSGHEAAVLVSSGAIDGLSIGYRTKRSERDGQGRRVLKEVELWEVSLVTFPMLNEARVGAKAEDVLPEGTAQNLAGVFRTLRHNLAG